MPAEADERPGGADVAGSGGAEAAALRRDVAAACRILAAKGLVSGILGHVSARWGEGMLLRCRGPRERGLMASVPEDVRQLSLGGDAVDDVEGWAVPNEHPIHGELYRARPEVGAVVHAHPRSALLCGLARLRPVACFGAFDIPAMRLALGGVPVYPRAVLISRAELARDMVVAMAGRPACILYGHGITVVGATVAQATVTAVALDRLLGVTVELAQLGAHPARVPDADLAELPDLGPAFNEGLAWQALLAELGEA
ncbi:MAG: class II aldolase/adducin family protein [Acidimicrobiia bacterium]|nr:class II aldolase/adducin family protein [Acidimicrobiia bacterium]